MRVKRRKSPATLRAIGLVLIAFVLLAAAGVGLFAWLQGRGIAPPVPGQQRCVATAGGYSATLDLDQAHFASIIVGVSITRGLPPRAATIALTTAYAETGIRNLDHGDRDSVGLFQQRPSQGWGTEKQLLDPYYSTGKFYDALLKVKGWRTGDITTIAQQVQRSGYPEAYRPYEGDSRAVASALTGQTPAGWSCLERAGTPGDAAGLEASLKKTFGALAVASAQRVVTVNADSARLAWAYGSYALANSRSYGVVAITIGNRSWHTDALNLPSWLEATPSIGSTQVTITLR